MRLLASSMLLCAFAFAPTAHADPAPSPFDPHVPNVNVQNCPGGNGGFVFGYCDGERYPDGSYWHQVFTAGNFAPISYTCVIDDGSPTPPPAPPGGCDGKVQAPAE
ncbi:hypothetical protein A5772_21530 [Mycolicibacter sinensis]|uniref:Secreted protein n=1 Tax=Mycolicibacter sinensis (strain JDM601) TaxID=875328 RepID=A0A1A2EWD6_MYCSD|nr:hypothetical protein A5772_21530 [Mycolicibacter sinensis]OBG09397.1 hypothetical protein A5771_01565 [Mycolicibacter sinensis]